MGSVRGEVRWHSPSASSTRTCRLCDVNPFEYLNALQHHAQAVIRDAARWLPWNYREQLIGAP